MTTPLDIIKGSLRLVGVLQEGETPNSSQSADAFQVLNFILNSWNNQRLMLYSIKNVIGTLTANKLPHSIGTGGDINTPRPLKVEKAFVRVPALTNPIDYLMKIDDNNRYQEFAVKKIGVNYPTNLYYEPTFPLGNLYIYPVQTMNLEVHLSLWMQLTEFVELNETIALPPGYENAIRYQLALDIAPEYDKSFQRGHPVFERAAELLREIKTTNQPKYVANIDNALLGNVGSRNFSILRGF